MCVAQFRLLLYRVLVPVLNFCRCHQSHTHSHFVTGRIQKRQRSLFTTCSSEVVVGVPGCGDVCATVHPQSPTTKKRSTGAFGWGTAGIHSGDWGFIARISQQDQRPRVQAAHNAEPCLENVQADQIQRHCELTAVSVPTGRDPVMWPLIQRHLLTCSTVSGGHIGGTVEAAVALWDGMVVYKRRVTKRSNAGETETFLHR